MDFIFNYFPNLSHNQKNQFELLFEHYKYWNNRINVISRKDIDYFYLHHVLHSLSIAKFLTLKPDSKLLDVGTGGGFPGVPLAIFFPEVAFHLVDSVGKKIKVIDAVIKELDIKNIHTYHERMEQLDIKVDFVVSRAVAPLKTLVHWTADKISSDHRHTLKNGFLCLKGGDLKSELKGFQQASVTPLSSYFEESFFDTKKLVYCPLD
ncbi:MAG: 16S rRNA (guanine(527)-N(7))-methyltransferase RsmG [Flavobacteriaceae bacterium]